MQESTLISTGSERRLASLTLHTFFAIFCYPPGGPIQKRMGARSPFFNLNHFFRAEIMVIFEVMTDTHTDSAQRVPEPDPLPDISFDTRPDSVLEIIG